MSFDVNRLRRADWIVGGGAVALFIFMFFFKWLGYSSNVSAVAGVNVNSSFSLNGWHSFTNSRWIWLITIIVALGAVVLVAGERKLESPVQLSVIVLSLGALSSLLILYRIIDHPSASASLGSFHASFGIKLGIWLGLIAALAITYGGYLQMQEEGASLSGVRDQAAGAIGGMTSSSGGGSTGAGAPGGPAPTPTAPSASAPATPPIPPPVAPPEEGSGGMGA
ncbi:MAG TPA: hypothetical protein VES65_07675 [Solirubrobacteraceae bacterium]|nr:hypothetical protein [Solirubrobacteraceae bacterium]